MERLSKLSYNSIPRRDLRQRERNMTYTMSFIDRAKQRWELRGYKRIAPTSSLDAWRQTSTLHVELARMDAGNSLGTTAGAGAAHVDLTAFLFEQLPSIEATGPKGPKGEVDKTQADWAVAEFSKFFFGTLQRIYLPALRHIARRARTARHNEELDP